MKFLVIFLAIIAVLIFIILRLKKSGVVITKERKNIAFIVSLWLASLSILAVLISFYLSKDINKLYPITLPILLLLLAWTGKRNNERAI